MESPIPGLRTTPACVQHSIHSVRHVCNNHMRATTEHVQPATCAQPNSMCLMRTCALQGSTRATISLCEILACVQYQRERNNSMRALNSLHVIKTLCAPPAACAPQRYVRNQTPTRDRKHAPPKNARHRTAFAQPQHLITRTAGTQHHARYIHMRGT